MSTSQQIVYWEERARKFAREGAGLRAVCSYGIPWFYNSFIHCSQFLALRRWLSVPANTAVLDVGCGIGRWSRMLARQRAEVTGVDLAPTMIEEARRRTGEAGLEAEFLVGDLTELELPRKFDLIVGVTVLQHIMDDGALQAAVTGLMKHLTPGGRLVLLEAAPSRSVSRCDTSIFRARTAEMYRDLFDRAGLRIAAETGVDPTPFKTLYLPFHRQLPQLIANAMLFLVTLVSLPIDLVFGRRLANGSWHKVFVLEHRDAH